MGSIHLRTVCGVLAACNVLLQTAARAQSGDSDMVKNSVVRIFSTVRYPDFYKPWTKQAAVDLSGTGVVIEGKRILTCAHAVLYANEIQVLAEQSGDKAFATIEYFAPDMDLAILKLDDESFFQTHRPLPRVKTATVIGSTVLAYGFPVGGGNMSITKGIVSRIDYSSYNFPSLGVKIQIDAALNPGNSGGPVVAGGRMIGLAYSTLLGAQSIGFIIPTEEIDLFLDDVADGQFDGKANIWGNFQPLNNPALRAYLKLDKAIEGILVRVSETNEPSSPLKDLDIITKVSERPINNEGMTRSTAERQVPFRYLISKTAKNGKVTLTVLRDGKEMNLEVPVPHMKPLVLLEYHGAYPSYFIYGPIVFSDATLPYVAGFTRGYQGGNLMTHFSLSGSPLIDRLGDKPAFEGERLVVISSPLFTHRITKGYSDVTAQVVKCVNGVRIKNLAHLVAILRDAKDEFITFEMADRQGMKLVFRREEIAASTEEILADNGIRTQGSPDVLAIWNGKSAK